MLEYIDRKLGPMEKSPAGLLKKDYVLHLQKIIVYFNQRAGCLTLKKERQLRRQYFEYKKWDKYAQVIKDFESVRIMRHYEFTDKACLHLGVPT